MDQSISFSHSFKEWQVENVPFIHSYIIYSSTTGCILFASKEICLTEQQEYFLPPSNQDAIQIVNQNHLSLFILPFYHHPSQSISYRSFQLPIDYQEDDQACHVSLTFPHRKEWINGMLLNSTLAFSSSVVGYTLEEGSNQFIDVFDITSSSFIRFGYFRQAPYSNIHFLFTHVLSCQELAKSIQFVSYPLLRLFPGLFSYFNQESVRIQLPCSSVYTYQLLPVKSKNTEKEEYPFTIRSSGMLVSKRASYQSFVVYGQYKQEHPLLSAYSIQPPEVTIPITIHHSNCSSSYLYRVVIELDNDPIGFSRFYFLDSNNRLVVLWKHILVVIQQVVHSVVVNLLFSLLTLIVLKEPLPCSLLISPFIPRNSSQINIRYLSMEHQ